MEKNKQETALDWFIEKIGYQKNGEWYIGIREDINIQHWVDQVRQMEKDQIINARVDGIWEISKCTMDPTYTFPTSEQYYNEIYGKTDSN
jgi:hypothetical protein